MKFENVLRTQVMVIGFGAALLLAGPARSQEIVNSEFPDGPNVAAFDQTIPVQTASVATTKDDESMPAYTAATLISPATEPASDWWSWSSIQEWLIPSSLACLALVAIYALALARRANRMLNLRSNSNLDRPAALS